MSQKPVTWISFRFGPDPEGAVYVVGIRVVLSGREGKTIYGKSLNYGEPDDGQGIALLPGEQLVFPSGNIKATVPDVDRESIRGPDGYAPLANTIWTWLHIPPYPDEKLFNYLFSMARRLDTAHDFFVTAIDLLNEKPDASSLDGRAKLFRAWGHAEMASIALYRAILMIREFPSEFSSLVTIPKTMDALFPALEEIRHSFEHIEDRAKGQVRHKPHQDAASAFHQSAFLDSGILRYAGHSLDLRKEALPALIAGRQQLFDIAVEQSGPAKVINKTIKFNRLPEQPSNE